MPRVLQLQDNTNITIESTPFGSGGSGDVFKILSPTTLTHQVVKLYHKERLTNDAELKIKDLATRKVKQSEHESIIWVKNIVFESGTFVGFTMNFANGINLEKFLNDRWWRKNETKDWDKFKLDSENGLDNRLKLCLNIAKAVYILHQNKDISIVDIKPSNFIINKNGLVSIIDIDNIEIAENGKVIYSAQVISTDYSPPEFHKGLDYKKNIASQNWDNFSLAIVFYNILCGIHPFTGGCISPYETCSDYPDMIKNGLFPHGKKSKYFNFIQPQHSNFLKLNHNIQSLFIQCFDNGHESPHLRPNAEDWCKHLSSNHFKISRQSLAEYLNEFNTYNHKLKNALQLETYSELLQLKTKTKITFPKVTFHDSSKILTPFDKFLIYFKKSPKQEQISELKAYEEKIKQKLQNEKVFQANINDTVSEFDNKQYEINNKEKIEIEKLKKGLQLSVDDTNYLLNEKQNEEEKELSNLFSQINELIQKENNTLSNFHKLNYGDLVYNYEVKKNEFQTNYNAYEVQKKNEAELLINSKNKLSNYAIEKECFKIFGSNLPSVVTALKQLNFFTAADFSRVSGDGCLLDNSSNWIKIPGLGTERANKLRSWRISIDLSENVKINSYLKSKYDKLQNEISIQWNATEKKYQQTIAPLEISFRAKENDIKRNKDRLIETRELEKDKIKSKYNQVHKNLKDKFIASLNKFYTDLEDIYTNTKAVLNHNLELYESKLQFHFLEAQKVIDIIQAETNEYNQLYKGLLKKP